MSRRQRQDRIVAKLEAEGGLDVSAMAVGLHVSTMTIRRDLGALEAQGRLIRTYGGAVPARRSVVEFRFAERHQSCLAEKRAIAGEAARLLAPGQSVLLDTGTTALEVARSIRAVADLRVVTASLAVAGALYAQSDLELILLGGTVRDTSPDLSGPLTEANLAGFHVDVAFLGADGADPGGVYTESVSVGRLSGGMIACADRVVLVADHTKFARPAFRRYASWQQVDLVITDDGVPHDIREWLDRATSVCYAGTQ